MFKSIYTRLIRFKKDIKGGFLTIELIILFPVLILLLFTILEVTLLYSANRRVNSALGETANIIAAETEIKKSDLDLIVKGAALMIGAKPDEIKLDVISIYIDGNKQASSKSQYNNGHVTSSSINNNASLPSDIKIPDAMNEEETGLIYVKIDYQYKPKTMSVFSKNFLNIRKQTYYKTRRSIATNFSTS